MGRLGVLGGAWWVGWTPWVGLVDRWTPWVGLVDHWTRWVGWWVDFVMGVWEEPPRCSFFKGLEGEQSG